MKLSPRQYLVLQMVDKFTMLTTTQLQKLCFPDARTRSYYYRVIQEMIDQKLLEPISARSGAMRVYQLGSAGWRIMRSGRRSARVQVDNHCLLLADTYIALQGLSGVSILHCSVEPDSWLEIANLQLKPDIDVLLELSDGRKFGAFIEVDTGTEHLKRLKDKFDSYTYAYKHDSGTSFPVVLFICTSPARASYLRDAVKRGGYNVNLFQAVLLEDLPSYIAGL